MPFFRIKTINGKEYIYLVKSYRQYGDKSKVKKSQRYLGKAKIVEITLEELKNIHSLIKKVLFELYILVPKQYVYYFKNLSAREIEKIAWNSLRTADKYLIQLIKSLEGNRSLQIHSKELYRIGLSLEDAEAIPILRIRKLTDKCFEILRKYIT